MARYFCGGRRAVGSRGAQRLPVAKSTSLNLLGFLADCLLIYDQVAIPADPVTLNLLYSHIPPTEMNRLLHEHRLVFCPAASMRFLHAPDNATVTHSSVISGVQSDLGFLPDPDYVRQIVGRVDQHLLMALNADYRRWRDVFAAGADAFNQVATRPGYEWLYPGDPRGSRPSRDRFVRLRSGIARMSDLVAAGVADFEMDEELPVLLEVCFPNSDLDQVIGVSKVKSVEARDVVRTLHRIENLAPLSQFARERGWSTDVPIDTLLSDEANMLRRWLRENAVPGADVREAYMGAEKSLPSNKKLNSWLRFGAVTGVSTAVGLLFANSLAGALAGAAVALADQAVGPGAQQRLSDPYHPNSWLSFVQRL